jgi:hypothetical protein
MRRAVPPVLIVLVEAVLIAWFLETGWARTGPGFPFDDGWIHAVFARNLVRTGALGFYPGQWTGGATSPLWVLLLAAGQVLGLSAPVTAAVYGGLAWAAAGLAGYGLLLDHGLGREAALAWSLAVAAVGPLTYLALSGMETALFLALGLAAILAFCRDRHGLAGLALALLLLTRVEGVALAGVLGLALVLRGRRRSLPSLARLLAPPLAALVVYGVYNLAATGAPFPSTMAGRKWLWGLPDRLIAFSPAALAGYVGVWRRYVECWLFHANAVPGPFGVAYRLVLWA